MKNNINLNDDERAYKSVSNYTGICLLFFVAFINVSEIPRAFLDYLESFLSYETYYTLSQIIEIITYLISFIVPALILRLFLKHKGLLQPMRLEFRPSKNAWLLIPATMGVNLCASYLNSLLMSVFGLSEAYADMALPGQQPYEPYQILLLFVLMALVPAVCEEFFFRGTILSNLLPFGQGTAIVGSAILFGLMHQNPYQLLYTAVSGLMMGYAYVKTGSIWYPTIIHFANNALAVLQEVLYANCAESVVDTVMILVNTLIMAVGFFCFAVYLIIDSGVEKNKYKQGSFGRLLPPCDGYAQRSVRPRNKIRLFFSPGMIAFVIIAVLNMLSLMATLALYSFLGGAV